MNKEIESVIQLEPFKRYQYSIKKIVDFEEIWLLTSDDKLSISEIEDKSVIPIWPLKEYVLSNMKEGWEDCQLRCIDLTEFDEKILPFIEKEELLIDIFPVNGISGFIVSIKELLRDLRDEMAKYE